MLHTKKKKRSSFYHCTQLKRKMIFVSTPVLVPSVSRLLSTSLVIVTTLWVMSRVPPLTTANSRLTTQNSQLTVQNLHFTAHSSQLKTHNSKTQNHTSQLTTPQFTIPYTYNSSSQLKIQLTTRDSNATNVVTQDRHQSGQKNTYSGPTI